MQTTDEKIIYAAKELFATKGYAGTTTKEIAEKAGVSEVTVFRKFESKRNLYDKALKNLFQHQKITNYLEDGVTYDLENDLTTIAIYMNETYRDNAQLLKMLFRDIKPHSEHKEKVEHDEHHMVKEMENYFNHMHEMGKIADDPKMAMKFFFMNINGYLVRHYVFTHHQFSQVYYDWMVAKTINALKA